jgi:hypothetical protein
MIREHLQHSIQPHVGQAPGRYGRGTSTRETIAR